MLKPVHSVFAALAVALVTVSTAAAVTGGGVDGDAHPYVGALVVNGSVECSGVLVAPTVFVTAGHCGADGTSRLRQLRLEADRRLEPPGRNPRGRPDQGSRSCRRRARRSCRRRTREAAGRRLGRLARQGRARDERRLRVLGLGGGRELRLRRPPSRGELARHEGLQVDALPLDDPRRALPRRLRRASAVGQHRALADLVRLQGLLRQGRGLSARHAVGARRSSAASSRFRNFRPGSIVEATWKCC